LPPHGKREDTAIAGAATTERAESVIENRFMYGKTGEGRRRHVAGLGLAWQKKKNGGKKGRKVLFEMNVLHER